MNIKTPPMPKPDFTINWRGWGYTVTKPAVGDTDVYTAAQLSARDQQWIEMVRPVVEALQAVLPLAEEALVSPGLDERIIDANAALSQIKGE